MGLFQKLLGKVLSAASPHRILRAAGRAVGVSRTGKPSYHVPAKKEREQPTGEGYRVTDWRGMEPPEIMPISEELAQQIEEEKKSARERMREEQRRRDPAFGFVELQIPLVNGVDFTSTNVHWVQYDKEVQRLFIEYRSGHKTDGRLYAYSPVSETLARAAFESSSKGIFVWDNLRLRGTLLGHRLSYALVSGGAEMPKWTTTTTRIRQHDITVGEESGEAGPHPVLQLGALYGPHPAAVPPYRALGRFMLDEPIINRPPTT